MAVAPGSPQFPMKLFPATSGDMKWWQKSVVYQVYPRSFQDSNGDGIGDLQGIISRLEYLKSIGVELVWLSPFFKSPMVDFGYDISDFCDVDPIFGTMSDFDELMAKMKALGLRFLMDMIPNHTSDRHRWFIASEAGEEKYKDYYVWHDGIINDAGERARPNNWVGVFGHSTWEWSEKRQQYYYHAFVKQQPDLNYRNPAVREEMKEVFRFWLRKGVHAFRLDAVAHCFESENVLQNEKEYTDRPETLVAQYEHWHHTLTIDQPELAHLLGEWRDVCREFGDDKFVISEQYADEDSPISTVMHHYSMVDAPFNFTLIDALYKGVTAKHIGEKITEWLLATPTGGWPIWVTGNHDRNRVCDRLGSEQYQDLTNMLLLLLPGTPVTYQGEEIGMTGAKLTWEQTIDPWGLSYGKENYEKFSRDPCRAPMQWDATPHAGFSTVDTWLPVANNFTRVNVKAQDEAPENEQTTLRFYRKLTALRRTEDFQRGGLDMVHLTDHVMTFRRGQHLICLNFGGRKQACGVVSTDEQLGGNQCEIICAASKCVSAFPTVSKMRLSDVKLHCCDGVVLKLL